MNFFYEMLLPQKRLQRTCRKATPRLNTDFGVATRRAGSQHHAILDAFQGIFPDMLFPSPGVNLERTQNYDT